MSFSCVSWGFNWLSVSRHSRSPNNLITSSLTFFLIYYNLFDSILGNVFLLVTRKAEWLSLIPETMFCRYFWVLSYSLLFLSFSYSHTLSLSFFFLCHSFIITLSVLTKCFSLTVFSCIRFLSVFLSLSVCLSVILVSYLVFWGDCYFFANFQSLFLQICFSKLFHWPGFLESDSCDVIIYIFWAYQMCKGI